MCGWIGNDILARAPIRPNSAWKALGVIGPSRSVIKTCEDGSCSRCRRRSARISSPCIGWITQTEYDKKARELKDRQTEIGLRIEQHHQGDGDYRATLESLISLASRAAQLFERSKAEQKRELIAFVFSNLRLKGKKLEFSLRSPFDLMVNRRDHSSWLAFLNTVRTERFDQVLALRPLLPTIAKAA
jgi:hypothetical protein